MVVQGLGQGVSHGPHDVLRVVFGAVHVVLRVEQLLSLADGDLECDRVAAGGTVDCVLRIQSMGS